MQTTTHAIGIDLGTTYSSIAYLNEHGEPVTLPNQEGELSTPSAVLFDGDEVIVGTEALRNAILHPERVIQNSKRYIGDAAHRWTIDGKSYTPVDIATLILKKLISAAQERLGPIEQAVITVPAQFSDSQRQATITAGHRAGLQRVDIINEPVAAALCYVLGTEGLWFSELAEEQRILVYDLGGGTFDLSLVRYQKNEVSVIASAGDLNCGGIDWNRALLDAIAKQFSKEFGVDPRDDPASLQFLALEVEQTKRGLSVRPRAALTCQHGGFRKTYQVEQAQFEKLTRHLVDHTTTITRQMLKEHQMGWAHVDVVLTTGGSSRMPMIREKLKELSGRTLNTTLSPDQSIAHGATYYAGMLLSNSKFARSILNEKASERLSQIRQKSVNARALGILVRDVKTNQRIPHYLIPANTPLPASATENFGTIKTNQRRVHLQIVESGIAAGKPFVKLGDCVIDELPPKLPEGSLVAVTISYDEQARVHVSAVDVSSGKQAQTEIIRQENLVPQLESQVPQEDDFAAPASKPSRPQVQPVPRSRPLDAAPEKPISAAPRAPETAPAPRKASRPATAPARSLAAADRPVPLCNSCGEPLNDRGECPTCGPAPKRPAADPARPAASQKPARRPAPRPAPVPKPVPPPKARPADAARQPIVPPLPNDDDFLELDDKRLRRPSDG